MMHSFEDFALSTPLRNALADLGFEQPTPIQAQAFSVVRSGKDVVGISQTGTGKTAAYMLPLLQDLKFSTQTPPRILILVPTRELVQQVMDQVEQLTTYINVRVQGVYGGTNINTQKQAVSEGVDILVATPGRLYDLAVSKALLLRDVKKLVIDEVDQMLDLGFRFQLANIFDLLPAKRQNIMFSATMTEEVDELIDEVFITPEKISIAVSGTPLDNIEQNSYPVQNFHTKVNLLAHLLLDDSLSKVLVFISGKSLADTLFDKLGEQLGDGIGVIHSNKSQNQRFQTIEEFDEGKIRVLIATDVMARGLDLHKITHVINFDVPTYPENYMHRIGRTGRAQEVGQAITLYTSKEEEAKLAIEVLMQQEIPEQDFPEEVEVNYQLIPEEKSSEKKTKSYARNAKKDLSGPSFHEKSAKNSKVNLGGSYKRKIAEKYKKPRTKGDKIANQRRKKKR